MDIALLNVKITFQKNEVMVDKIGNHKNVWTDFYKCFATASGEGGSEKAVALQSDTAISCLILILLSAVSFLMVMSTILFLLTT